MTSHDVVNRVRKITGVKRVGHGGTLDPNATGLLVVAVGREYTKQLDTIAHNTLKTYEAEIVLGESRDTDDVDGKTISKNSDIVPSEMQFALAVKTFLGESEQIPPHYSALKIKGKTAYSLARKGNVVELKPRKIMVTRIEDVFYKYPVVKLKLTVSSGTYIRAIARDLGDKLGCGAYLNELRRTQIGNFSITDAKRLEELNGL